MAPLPPALLPTHNKATFRVLRGAPPNRICFATTHQNALRENKSTQKPFKFSVPFHHGVGTEFWMGTDIKLWQNEHGPWIALTEAEANLVRDWISRQGTRVYIKDFFDCSVALGERTVNNAETELGVLFSSSKYHDEANTAKAEVLKRLKATWDGMRSLPRSGFVSAPPPRPGKDFDLPTALAERLAKHTGLTFAPLGEWKGDKGQMKDVPADKKWEHLEEVGFQVNPAIARAGKPVLIVDDIYQSGTTLNYLRASLTKVGVARASAISIVKAARDTDNQ